MYVLMISYDCGIYYQKDQEAETIDLLRPAMEKADKEMLRWYIEKDGKMDFEEMSSIHKQIVDTLEKLNRKNRSQRRIIR